MYRSSRTSLEHVLHCHLCRPDQFPQHTPGHFAPNSSRNTGAARYSLASATTTLVSSGGRLAFLQSTYLVGPSAFAVLMSTLAVLGPGLYPRKTRSLGC